MTIKPENFDTLFLLLDEDPIDLTENTTLLPWPPDVAGPEDADTIFTYASREVFIQTVLGSAKWRESDAAPASDDPGHILGLGDGVVVTLTRRARSVRGFWIWPGMTGTQIAVSPAAPVPARDATYDVPVAPDSA